MSDQHDATGPSALLAQAAVGLPAQSRGPTVILQERGGRSAECGEAVRVLQQPAAVVGALVLDAADPAGQDRPGLAFRVVAHRADRRTGQDQVGAQPIGNMADETLEDANSAACT